MIYNKLLLIILEKKKELFIMVFKALLEMICVLRYQFLIIFVLTSCVL